MLGYFVYANADKYLRRGQMQYLVQQRQNLRDILFLGGDLNEILEPFEKKDGRLRTAGSFRFFNDIIRLMSMEEVKCVRNDWSWANNREGEWYIEERL